MTLSRKLVQLVLAKQRAGAPPEIARKARVHIADALGVALGARRGQPVTERLLEALGYGDASGRCTVLGTTRKLPPMAAAFANSAGIHILDYEDMHDVARMHPTTVTLPAALAAAEVVGAPGRRILEGVLLGDELMIRLGLMLSPKGDGPASNWFLTQFFGYFSAAVAAGLVLELTEDQLVSAIGLAYMQAAGGKEAGFGVGSDARAIYPAFGSMGGLTAALLARAGIVGPQGALDGAASLFRVYMGAQPDDAALARLLDPAWWGFTDADTKPWPCCRLSHPYVSVALPLHERIAGRPIRRVRAAVNESAAKLCRPLDQRRRPTTLQDAKFSIPFMTAFALVHGKVTLQNLGMQALGDTAVLDVARVVEIEERLPDNLGHPPAELVVELADGEKLASPAFGDIRLPEARIRDKFVDCLTHVGQGSRAGAAWDTLMRIDTIGVDDVLRAIPVV